MLRIVFIVRTIGNNYAHDCGSFTLTSKAAELYQSLFEKPFDRVEWSRHYNFPNFPQKRMDERMVKIIETFGVDTCVDCILGIQSIIPSMLNYFSIECSDDTKTAETIVFLENKYTLHYIRHILYYDMSYDNIIENLNKLVKNKSGMIIYKHYKFYFIVA